MIGLDAANVEQAPGANLCSYEQLALPSPRFGEILRERRPDLVIHCAGRTSVPLSVREPYMDYQSGPALTVSLLEAIRLEAPATKFIFLSSAAVYGCPIRLPISEMTELAPISPYGYHKWQCELLCREYQQSFQIPTCSVRIFSAYGPGLRRQVIWDLCAQAITQGRISAQGSGSESRDFIHVMDIVSAVRCISEKAPLCGEVYNVASGEETSVRSIAELIVAALDETIPIDFSGTVPAGTPLNWRADIAKIKKMGFSPGVQIKKGISQFVRWAEAELGRGLN